VVLLGPFLWGLLGEFSEYKSMVKGDLRKLLQRLGGVLKLEQFLVQEGTLIVHWNGISR